MNKRMRWLLLVLAAVLLASLWPHGGEEETEVVEAAKRQSPRVATSGPALPVAKPVASAARDLGPMKANLFPVQSWKPPPPKPPPVVAMPPPRPSPPPMPFRFMGRWVEPDGLVVFLTQGETVLLARKGDTLAGSWRVDEITQGQMNMTYLPLNMQQTLRIVP